MQLRQVYLTEEETQLCVAMFGEAINQGNLELKNGTDDEATPLALELMHVMQRRFQRAAVVDLPETTESLPAK